jgi:hypothetical protein
VHTGIRPSAHCYIADRDEHVDTGTSNRHLDSDANAICNCKSDPHTNAIVNANSDGHANPHAVPSPFQARHLCAIASLARL